MYPRGHGLSLTWVRFFSQPFIGCAYTALQFTPKSLIKKQEKKKTKLLKLVRLCPQWLLYYVLISIVEGDTTYCLVLFKKTGNTSVTLDYHIIQGLKLTFLSSRQLVNKCGNLVAKPSFLVSKFKFLVARTKIMVALATSWSQFQTLLNLWLVCA